MTSDFEIIDFKNLGKREINGFLNEKADNVWYDGRHGNPAVSVRMIVKVYLPGNFKETLINEGLKLLSQKREEYKSLKPSALYEKEYSWGRTRAFCNYTEIKPVKINGEEFKGASVYFNTVTQTGKRSAAVYTDEEFIKLVSENKIYLKTYNNEPIWLDAEKNRYYIQKRVHIDTEINRSESRFFNRSKSKSIWRKRVKEAYENLINNGFDIPVWKNKDFDEGLFFEQKI